MLQQPEPDDFVIATGRTHSVRQFVEAAFHCVGLDAADYVVIDERLYRPAERNILVGDPSKARRILHWEATTGFDTLVREMVTNDCALLAENQ
jgi:GDPmannose 4,6-dehydratase